MPAPATVNSGAQLIEVFSSIQGEGDLVGFRQVFLRMACCNLACSYCDTPFAPREDCRIEDAPGSGQFVSLPNPVALETLYNILFRWQQNAPGLHHSLSVTGGEPLVQAEVLKEWLPTLRKVFPVHLETNGTLPDALAGLMPHLDSVAMDIKLASVCGIETPWHTHRRFLEVARAVSCQVKTVVGEETPIEEVEQAARLVRDVAPDASLIIQPVTRAGRVDVPANALMALHEAAARIHPPSRLIPQTHVALGLL